MQKRREEADFLSKAPFLNYLHYLIATSCTWGTWWRSWLRHCATSQKDVGSIPDGVIGIFD